MAKPVIKTLVPDCTQNRSGGRRRHLNVVETRQQLPPWLLAPTDRSIDFWMTRAASEEQFATKVGGATLLNVKNTKRKDFPVSFLWNKKSSLKALRVDIVSDIATFHNALHSAWSFTHGILSIKNICPLRYHNLLGKIWITCIINFPFKTQGASTVATGDRNRGYLKSSWLGQMK